MDEIKNAHERGIRFGRMKDGKVLDQRSMPAREEAL
jgi:hypothetical protein